MGETQVYYDDISFHLQNGLGKVSSSFFNPVCLSLKVPFTLRKAKKQCKGSPTAISLFSQPRNTIFEVQTARRRVLTNKMEKHLQYEGQIEIIFIAAGNNPL
jgi:hypothetical protein